MMTFPNQPYEQDEYRVVLVMPRSQMVLAKRDGKKLRLPRINIHRWSRHTEQLNEAVQAKWKVRSLVLDFLSEVQSVLPCAVVEARGHSSSAFNDGFLAVRVDDLDDQELTVTEQLTVQSILAGSTRDGRPFSRLGWIDEAQQWIRDNVRDHDVLFNEEIHQLNAGATFALIRFGTRQGPAYWLKATGIPNQRELSITTMLARYFPAYLPRLVAERDDWNAWVTEDAGLSLRVSFSKAACEQAAIGLAELQCASFDRTDALLQAGWNDLGIKVIESHLDEMTEDLAEVMEQQTSTRVSRLSRGRLNEMRDELRNACSQMSDLGIPDALIHNDINPGNILFDGVHCVFTDWAEAAVGHPFLTFEQLSVHIARYGEEARGWLPELRSLYQQRWRPFCSETELGAAFRLSPILAIASHLYGRGSWLHSEDRHRPAFQGYRRSVARYIDRAALALEHARTSC